MDNSLKLFDYKECVNISTLQLEKYRDQQDSAEYADVVNMIIIYEPLVNIPRQQVTIPNDVQILVPGSRL